MAEIGATLREARMRARIDVSEIEAQTKIRAKYLRALENEEWDLLPGPTYVKSFLRTYAQALGLDSKVLLEQYRISHERPTDAEMQPIMPASRRQRERTGAPRSLGGPWFAAVVGVLLIIIVLAVVGLLSSHSSSPNSAAVTPPAHHAAHRHRAHPAAPPPLRPGVVSLSVKATAPVWICLLARGNRTLINGVILTPADATRTYRSSRFLMTLGNGSVVLRVNGQPLAVGPSGQPISFALTASGRHPLTVAELPRCA